MPENYLIDAINRRWSIRRTSIDVPGRAYATRLIDYIDDTAQLMPGVIGFYAESIDDIRHTLATGIMP